MRTFTIHVETDNPHAPERLRQAVEGRLLESVDVDDRGVHHDAYIVLTEGTGIDAELLFATELDGAANNGE